MRPWASIPTPIQCSAGQQDLPRECRTTVGHAHHYMHRLTVNVDRERVGETDLEPGGRTLLEAKLSVDRNPHKIALPTFSQVDVNDVVAAHVPFCRLVRVVRFFGFAAIAFR